MVKTLPLQRLCHSSCGELSDGRLAGSQHKLSDKKLENKKCITIMVLMRPSEILLATTVLQIFHRHSPYICAIDQAVKEVRELQQ